MATITEKNIAAVLPEAKAPLAIQELPIPQPGPDELLVRSRYIAVNPVDWVNQETGMFVHKYPTVLGSDVAGEVVAVGGEVTVFKAGDRVTGYAPVVYSQRIEHGGFQTFVLLRELATSHVPDGMNLVDASVLPMAIVTAGLALFDDLGLPREPVAASAAKKGLLVWSGASSVGSMGIQFGRLQGYTVYTTASRKNHGWLKELGAARLFDYRDGDVTEQIIKQAKADGVRIEAVFDAVAKDDSFAKTADVAAAFPPARISSVLPRPDDQPAPEGVTVFMTRAWLHGTDRSDLGRWLFNDVLAKGLRDGGIVPAPKPQIVEGGLKATPEAFAVSKSGVSGVKLVIKVD